MSTDYKVGLQYSFDLYTAALTGNNYKNVTVMSVMDGETANTQFDVVGTHKQLYPLFKGPSGAADDPLAYTYLKLKMPDGSRKFVAIPWIDDSSVTSVANGVITVKIYDQQSGAQADVRNALLRNGFSNMDLSFSTTGG
jgi:hypothetical protein